MDQSPQLDQKGSAVVVDGVVAAVVVVAVVVDGVTGGLIPRLLMENFLPLALNFPVTVQPFSVANETGTFWHLAFWIRCTSM